MQATDAHFCSLKKHNMNNFKIKFKITGLELEMQGTREDVQTMTAGINQQFHGLLQSPSLIASDGAVASGFAEPRPELQLSSAAPTKNSRPRKNRTTSTAPGKTAKALELVNKPDLYGTPTQNWKAVDKAIWLLYVLKKESNVEEVSGQVLVWTFNKHFKEAGMLRPSNIVRDLGTRKLGATPQLGENANTTPSGWFLTQAGIEQAENLIKSLRQNAANG
jgi:hypothetical protein